MQDPRDTSWRFWWWENGKRKSKVLGRFPTKAKAWAASKPYRDKLESPAIGGAHTLAVDELVHHYRQEMRDSHGAI